MSLTIQLSPQEEERLREEAARQGLPPEQLVLRAVRSLIPDSGNIEARLARLDSVLLGASDEEDQKDTGELLRKALGEDRLISSRKLFP